ncbi:thioredoxin domain-containing protein [Pyruvatibacter sp.]|uniref:thioredoxin domain-containing protein n=1 Tax=Pyruvatibacter sp. TaxID=1981328 RepID=UPI0032EFF372
MSQNLLAEETSPYLLQHKDNPVHWHPWGPQALAQAKASNKPILLSVGYAACHWCHVMAHESFEDEDVAAVMNELFVNIKVDREERPDIDTIYMSALHHLGEQGGWPLTMFLTPDGEPFWGGTYFPKTAGYGRPGFPDVLREVSRIYHDEGDKVAKNRDALREALRAQAARQAPGKPAPQILDEVADRLVRNIDPENGGIGAAPKFPQPFLLELLWRTWLRIGDERCRNAVTLTLTRMCQGGIYDHLGGGLARYAVDDTWLVPHFEKMLYDNASFIGLLTHVAKGTANPLFENRLRETISWVLREMVTAEGAFAASIDADSEGEEGKFYVWSEAEVDAALSDFAPAEVTHFKQVYDVTPHGNFEGHTILNRLAHPDALPDETEALFARMRQVLFTTRKPRVRPGWDDKALTDWNGQMIAALARAAGAFDEPIWLEAASTAFSFIRTQMIRNGRLHHAFRAGRLQHLAMADGYANMISAALALYETTGTDTYLAQARQWADELHTHYWDAEGGGYFFTADDAEALVVRTRSVTDDATPSANGTMIENLARLWYLTGDTTYQDRANSLVRTFAGELARNFFPMCTYLNGLDTLLNAVQVVIAGDGEEADDMRATALSASLPYRVINYARADLPPGHPAFEKTVPSGWQAAAYVCEGTNCSLPVETANALHSMLARPV